ncbi:hypothetical protein [Hymenobacter cavernae]|uniref:Uncharacterized protein n=1 Tax=Hymenobacter cavernae TaxID=2044852 RepID=A0ABQ1U457_9BACT|nr:hypothetical protein [Hymenobacter cavernae]GGF09743.1 hypothetical protein GCM10011383_21180 [Hymenobacter cavernae]
MKKSTAVLSSLLLLGGLTYLAAQVLDLRLFFDLRDEDDDIYYC